MKYFSADCNKSSFFLEKYGVEMTKTSVFSVLISFPFLQFKAPLFNSLVLFS